MARAALQDGAVKDNEVIIVSDGDDNVVIKKRKVIKKTPLTPTQRRALQNKQLENSIGRTTTFIDSLTGVNKNAGEAFLTLTKLKEVLGKDPLFCTSQECVAVADLVLSEAILAALKTRLAYAEVGAHRSKILSTASALGTELLSDPLLTSKIVENVSRGIAKISLEANLKVLAIKVKGLTTQIDAFNSKIAVLKTNVESFLAEKSENTRIGVNEKIIFIRSKISENVKLPDSTFIRRAVNTDNVASLMSNFTPRPKVSSPENAPIPHNVFKNVLKFDGVKKARKFIDKLGEPSQNEIDKLVREFSEDENFKLLADMELMKEANNKPKFDLKKQKVFVVSENIVLTSTEIDLLSIGYKHHMIPYYEKESFIDFFKILNSNKNRNKNKLRFIENMSSKLDIDLVNNFRSQQLFNDKDLKILDKLGRNYVISLADKNLGITVMDKLDYNTHCNDFLNRANIYEEITDKSLNDIKKDMVENLKTVADMLTNVIRGTSKRSYSDAYLLRFINDTKKMSKLVEEDKFDELKIGMFYAMLKLHKSPIKIRPITAAVNTINSELGTLIKILTEHYLKHNTLYKEFVVESFTHTVYKLGELDTLGFSEDAVFTAFDLEEYYLGMSHEKLLDHLEFVLTHYTDLDIPGTERYLFKILVRAYLKNSYFLFKEKGNEEVIRLFRQIMGIFMGGIPSVQLAQAFGLIAFDRVKTLINRGTKLFIVQYLDDVLVLAIRSITDNIKNHFTSEVTTAKIVEQGNKVIFLDGTLEKIGTENNRIVVKTSHYYKKLAKFEFCSTKSNVTYNNLKSVIIGKYTTLAAHCSNIADFRRFWNFYVQKFIARGYSMELINNSTYGRSFYEIKTRMLGRIREKESLEHPKFLRFNISQPDKFYVRVPQVRGFPVGKLQQIFQKEWMKSKYAPQNDKPLQVIGIQNPPVGMFLKERIKINRSIRKIKVKPGKDLANEDPRVTGTQTTLDSFLGIAPWSSESESDSD